MVILRVERMVLQRKVEEKGKLEEVEEEGEEQRKEKEIEEKGRRRRRTTTSHHMELFCIIPSRHPWRSPRSQHPIAASWFSIRASYFLHAR